MAHEAERGGYLCGDDVARLDLELVCDYPRDTYWASEVSREELLRSIRNSVTSGLYRGLDQVGFARAVTDYARFAYFTHVFVLEAHRGRGLGRWLVERVLKHSDLRNVRKWMLTTRDAHGLYESLEFTELDEPEWLMEPRR